MKQINNNYYYYFTLPVTKRCSTVGIVCISRQRITVATVSVQPRPTAVNMSLPAFAAERSACYRLIYPAARPTAANPPQWHAASIDGTDRLTDTRRFDRPRCAYYAGSVNH